MNDAPIHILLVEDEPDVCEVAEGLLHSFGFEVTAVANGEEALANLERAQPDLILSDIRMPAIDGFQLLQKVREDPIWHEIPFIIVSAKAESADLRMGMSLGADDYVVKPYRPADLRKTIEIRVQRAKQISDAIAGNQRFLTQNLPHELRTPLMGVIGYADLMVDTANEGKTLSVEELSEYGHMLQLSGARIYRVVENLLFWARLETHRDAPGSSENAQRIEEEVTPASLAHLAEAISRQFGRHQDVVVDCPSEVTVQVVTPGFKFVAGHIFENAFKYSLPGTPVRITGRTHERTFILSVSDAGRGMTAEQMESAGLFRRPERQRFEQQGLGMGLMLATTFLRLSGGHLELKPAASGTGLTVLMSLPLAGDPVPSHRT